MLQCLLPVVWVAMLAAALAAPAHADDARDCVQARDAATSIKACTELIRQQPANIVAYNHRGNGYRAAGRYDEAIANPTASVSGRNIALIGPLRKSAGANIIRTQSIASNRGDVVSTVAFSAADLTAEPRARCA